MLGPPKSAKCSSLLSAPPQYFVEIVEFVGFEVEVEVGVRFVVEVRFGLSL